MAFCLAAAMEPGGSPRAAQSASPEGSSQNPAASTPLRVSSDLVKIDVSVLDSRGNFVSGLAQADFRVLDDGEARPIALFAPAEAPAQILLLVEASPSVYLIRDSHLLGAYALLGALRPADEAALAVYNQAPRLILPFTKNKAAVANAIGGVDYGLGPGELNFYDSISQVVDWLAPRPGKNAIVLLSTGLDSSTPMHWSAVAQKVRASDLVIYAVALGGALRTAAEHPPEDKSGRRGKKKRQDADDGSGDLISADSRNDAARAFSMADSVLKSLATMTGGRAYFPEKPEDFVAIYGQISAALRHQYVLGIAPRRDGGFHDLTVQVLGAKKPLGTSSALASGGHKLEDVVLARQSYLAPAR